MGMLIKKIREVIFFLLSRRDVIIVVGRDCY